MRRQLSSILAVTLSFALMLGFTLRPVQAGAGDIGVWSGPIEVGVIGIHAALLPNGKVLLFGLIQEGDLGNRAKLFDPMTGNVTDVTMPYQRNIFCSGHAFLPDGRLLISGGEINETPGDEVGEGTRKSTIFDYHTNTWSETDLMDFARWYPTNVALPDGSQLVFSGRDERGEARIDEVERYQPGSASYDTLPPSATQDTNGLYPRFVLLPDGKVFQAGEDDDTRTFNPATNAWSSVDAMNEGRRTAGGVVLLPGLQKVLTAGGAATNTAEVIDFSQPSPQWQWTGSMNRVRNHANLVLLPDGTVLAVGGGPDPLPGDAATEAERYDPETETWTLMAAQAADRQYHSTALLLPDGRVLSAGDNKGNPYQTAVEIYSPPYLFHGPRPRIRSAPAEISYGESFLVRSRQAADITRVALVRPGATTHGNDMDQRYVDVAFSVVNGNLRIDAPANANLAPPGHYMLFILNANDVPSIAKFVHLD